MLSKHLPPFMLNEGGVCLEKTLYYHVIKDICKEEHKRMKR